MAKVLINFQYTKQKEHYLTLNIIEMKTNLTFVQEGDGYECKFALTEVARLYVERGDNSPLVMSETAQAGDKYAPVKEFGFDKVDPVVTVINTDVWPTYLKLSCKSMPVKAYYVTSE